MEHNICQNCNHGFAGNYCNNCGQKVFTESDKRLRSIFDEVLHFLTHLEGSFLLTFKTVLLRPGRLTVDYCAGVRKRYYKPISFFLLLILIYLLFPVMEGLNMRLEYYKGVEIFGDYITGQIADKQATMGISEAELGEIFKQKSEKTAKILLVLLLPMTAFVIYLIDFRKKAPVFDYFIAATELNIFFVLFFFIIMPLLFSIIMLLLGLKTLTETTIIPIFAVLFLLWLVPFTHRVLQKNWLVSSIMAIILILAHYVITMLFYKAILFETTFALI